MIESHTHKRLGVIVFLLFELLFLNSCEDGPVSLETEGYHYYYGESTFFRPQYYLERIREGDVSCFFFHSGKMFTEATGDLYEYNVEFAVIVRDSAFISGEKISLSANDYQQKWFDRYPQGFEDTEKTEASLCLYRTWSDGATAKGIAASYNKRFVAIDGWVRIVGYSKHYGAEYECRVVAESDGEILDIRGEYKLWEDKD